MKSGTEISILDPYEWLPSYGENSVSVESKGLDFVIKIEYDAEDNNQTIYCRELRFDMVCAFHRTTFPGVSILNIDYGKSAEAPLLGSLVEYPDSEVALAWNSHFGGFRQIKHYKIVFLSENIQMEIFANNVTLGAECIIPPK
ncbi:hypothetical protein [Dickeya chrysanthemi]|jgi:hypothetical protein|uniref:hypothetical protein n=1 Tax=Dickeya chrysanthemi TaxID=556 RepID=UPI000586B419|nr:hypothetical protein [Dickeya chrysanthemi]MBX9448151.1 hypothetical protein [Dickeya chrysanthemi]